MPTNRYFSPSRSQYVSQFVPRELNTQLMMGVLGTKQKQEDAKQAMLDHDSQYDFNAIKDAREDMAFKTKTLKEFSEKRDALHGVDITTDAAALRDYKKYVRDLQKNEDIKTVESRYAQHNEYQAWKDKVLKDPTKKGIGEGYFAEDMEWQQYKQGEGFRGSSRFGEHTEAADSDAILSKTLGEVQASGRDYDELKEGYKYGHGWTGINQNRLNKVYQKNYEQWMNGQVGAHMRQLVTQQLGYSNSDLVNLTPEKREEFNKAVDAKLQERFLAASERRIFSKTKETIDTAPTPGYDAAAQEVSDASLGATGEHLFDRTSLEGVIQEFNNTQNAVTSDVKTLTNILGTTLTPEQQQVVNNLPNWGKKAATSYSVAEGMKKGQTLSPEKMHSTIKELTITYNKFVSDPTKSAEDKEEALNILKRVKANQHRLNEGTFKLYREFIEEKEKEVVLAREKAKESGDSEIPFSVGTGIAGLGDPYSKQNAPSFQEYLREKQISDLDSPDYDVKQDVEKGYYLYNLNSTSRLKEDLLKNESVEGATRTGARFNLKAVGDAADISVGVSTQVFDESGNPMKVYSYTVGKSGQYFDPVTGILRDDGEEGQRKNILYKGVTGQTGTVSTYELAREIASSKNIDPDLKQNLITDLYANKRRDKNEISMISSIKNQTFEVGKPVKIEGLVYSDPNKKTGYSITEDIVVTLEKTAGGTSYYSYRIGDNKKKSAMDKKELWLSIEKSVQALENPQD